MPRPRLHPPWIPGFWALLAFLALLLSVAGYYYALAQSTRFERLPEKPEAAER
jgi:short subunit fatty acids transporter